MNRLLKIGIGLIVLLSLAAAAVPNVLSTEFVKSRIEAQLSEITGHNVSLQGRSSVSLSPYLGVEYSSVVVQNKIGEADKLPLLRVDVMKAKLSLFALLSGEVRVSNLHLVRPQLNLSIGINGERNWVPTHGKLAEIFKYPSGTSAPALALPEVIVEDGIVRMENEQSRITSEITSVGGTISWTRLSSGGDLEASAVWKGEVVSIKLESNSPLALFQGQKSNIQVSLSSRPIIINYSGGLLLDKTLSANGEFKFISSSPTRLANWLGLSIGAADLLGEIELSGKLDAKTGTIELVDSNIRIQDYNGTGRLSLSLTAQNRLLLQGTVAFDDIGYSGLLAAANPESNEQISPINPNDLSDFDLDLRLSAVHASVPPFELQDLAATALIKNGEGRFEVGHALMLDGEVSGSITVKPVGEPESPGSNISSDVVLSEINLAKFTNLLGEGALSLEGTGSASFQFKSVGKTSQELLSRLSGVGNLSGDNGTLTGVDLEKIFENGQSQPADGKMIKLDGSSPYSSIQLGFHLANGIAFLKDSSIVSDNIRTELWGQSDLLHRSLALRGRVMSSSSKSLDSTDNPSRSVSFFVGGNTTSPLFIPLAGVSQANN